MKNKIIAWIQGPRNYYDGVAIYQQHGYNNVLKKRFATKNDTTESLLFTKLCELANITEEQANRLPRMAVNRKPIPVVHPIKEYMDDALLQLMEKIGIDTATLEAETIPEDISENEIKKAAFAGAQKVYTDLPETTRRVIKIREQYPFLRSKDCPDEIKLLVHEMFNQYDNYREAHQRLVDAPDNTDLQESFDNAMTTVESYLSNRELWDELNYYKEKGEILGKHPLFEQYNREKELKSLTDLELSDKLRNARSNLSKAKNKLEQSAGNEKKIKTANEGIEKWSATVDQLNKAIESRKK